MDLNHFTKWKTRKINNFENGYSTFNPPIGDISKGGVDGEQEGVDFQTPL